MERSEKTYHPGNVSSQKNTQVYVNEKSVSCCEAELSISITISMGSHLLSLKRKDLSSFFLSRTIETHGIHLFNYSK